MLEYKKISQLLVLTILIIICGINTNFFKNFTEVILHKFDDRIVNRYGFCSGESIGYLLYLKKKYEIKNNPKIINYAHTPSVNWAIINTKNNSARTSTTIHEKYLIKNTLFEKGTFIPEVNNSMQVFIDDIEDAQYKMNKMIFCMRVDFLNQ